MEQNGSYVCTTKDNVDWVHCNKCQMDTPITQGEYPPSYCVWCGAKFNNIDESEREYV